MARRPVDTKLYDVLGVSPDVSLDGLKKAYRVMALKYHPDKNKEAGAEEKFKSVSEAFSILSNDEKRKMYDMTGRYQTSDASGAGRGGGGFRPEDIFSEFFGSSFFGMSMNNEKRNENRVVRGSDVLMSVELTLDELYNGCTKTVTINKQLLCEACKGKGSPDDVTETCKKCGGDGFIVTVHNVGRHLIQRSQSHCPDCNTTGKVIPPKHRCKACSGGKVIKAKKTYDVKIDPGSYKGQDIKLKGEADQAPNTVPGDLVFRIVELPHPRFIRIENDLSCTLKIDLYTAIAGGPFEVLHINNRILRGTIGHGDIDAPNTKKVIRGEGMPRYSPGSSPNFKVAGDLIINFELVLPRPSDIDYQNISKLKSVISFPAPKPIPVDNKSQIVKVNISDYVERSSSRQRHEDGYPDDEDQSHESSHIQCAQQ